MKRFFLKPKGVPPSLKETLKSNLSLFVQECLIRLEEGQKSLNQRICYLDNKLNKRIDDLINLIYVVLVGMFALGGFVLWDRRSALASTIRRTNPQNTRFALKYFLLP